MLVLLLGAGLYLTLGLAFLPQRKLFYGFRLMVGGRKVAAGHEGEITPFQALTTALSATIGTGNIAGVATAIFLGGPGAVFWMWLTALVGMATKYAEAVLAVRYRETDANGRYVGGPMYYIRNGLGRRWAWLGWLFALFATIAAFGIGNTVQSNSVAQALEGTVGIPTLATGLVLAALTFMVIIGGVKRIGSVAEHLVPLMAVLYIISALTILGVNYADVPAALSLIFTDAFTGTAAAGGFAGAGVMAAIRFGVARGVFSNEAGLGSAPIAHAAAKTNDPVRQGCVAMLGTFIDTILVCTMTALVILTTGAWTSGQTGAELSALAFDTGLPGGDWIVTIGLVVFAFTTILGWSYYGERAAQFIFGPKVVLPFRLLWVVGVVVGAVGNLGLIWTVADIMNALMAIPNLIALIALSGTVFAVSRTYFKSLPEK
ncbi:alanine/glycine:cation symporter family protein [Roseospira marina]|nr:sodium:alanine symporter family protein [Roseospira marina]MBB4315186.1 AGCS family alanine or glycine:cation symporter [Roseospira marina]MBB5088186.1 AGCS family alanine or glycine:cation symporter [Roseospira marina]